MKCKKASQWVKNVKNVKKRSRELKGEYSVKIIDPAFLKVNKITVSAFKNDKSRRTNRFGEEMIGEEK